MPSRTDDDEDHWKPPVVPRREGANGGNEPTTKTVAALVPDTVAHQHAPASAHTQLLKKEKSRVATHGSRVTRPGAVAVGPSRASRATVRATPSREASPSLQVSNLRPAVDETDPTYPSIALNDDAELAIAAEVVPSEQDLEAQRQERMQKEAKEIADRVHDQLMSHAVVAGVHIENDTASRGTSQDEEDLARQKRKRYICLAVIAFLVIAAAIGAGVGVSVSKDNSKSSPSSPPVAKCSFCFDGSTPPNLETNEFAGQTCAEYRESQILLDSTDSDCAFGQAVAWELCECPTLPPPPENPTCTLCENGATPSNSPNLDCQAYDNFIAIVGANPLFPCDELIPSLFEAGCLCPGDVDGGSVEAFQAVLQSISGETLNDQNSPQYKALNWIANEDPASMSVGSTPIETISTRYVAAVLYYALGGETWLQQLSFLSQGDICTWNENGVSGIVCDSNGDVVTLNMSESPRLNTAI